MRTENASSTSHNLVKFLKYLDNLLLTFPFPDVIMTFADLMYEMILPLLIVLSTVQEGAFLLCQNANFSLEV